MWAHYKNDMNKWPREVKWVNHNFLFVSFSFCYLRPKLNLVIYYFIIWPTPMTLVKISLCILYMTDPFVYGPVLWNHLYMGLVNRCPSQNQNQNKGPSGKEIFYRKPIKSRDKSKKLPQAQENSTSKVLIVWIVFRLLA